MRFNNSAHPSGDVFAHAPSRVSIEVPPGMSTRTGRVGAQDWVQGCGNGMTFEVWQAGAQLWASGVVMNYDEAVSMGSIAVVPGSVELVAGHNGEYSCDTAVWADVRVGVP